MSCVTADMDLLMSAKQDWPMHEALLSEHHILGRKSEDAFWRLCDDLKQTAARDNAEGWGLSHA